jgi:hypothetical protein
MNQDLFFNILAFDWPEEPRTVYFSLDNIPRTKRIHKSAFPENLDTIFPEITTDNIDFVYTSFGYPKEEFLPLSINLKDTNKEFAKYFYRDTLRYYFRTVKKQIVRLGFIDELEISVPSKKHSTKQFSVFEKFAIRVQIQEGSEFPSLLLSYEGKSKVLTTSVPELIKNTPPSLIKKVLYDNQIHKYEDLLELEDVDLNNSYPVLNPGLAKHLNLPFDKPPKENKYKRYHDQITTFYDYFLNKPAFKKLIPIQKQGFSKVPLSAIGEIKPESSDLAFYGNKVGRNPKKDFYGLKPAEKSPHKKVHIFFIYHIDDEAKKNDLKKYIQTGQRHYRGLFNYTGILNFIDDEASIPFSDKHNPLPELEAKWISHKHDTTNIKYLAIYLTPFSKEETSRQDKKVYVMVKEFLLKRSVVCQSVEPRNIGGEDSDFVFSLTTMSVAILAKLEGVPWRLHTNVTNELIVGVGAFENPTDGVRYLSSAFSFDNTGRFNSFEYFTHDETVVLAGNISAKVREFAMVNGTPNRLIIHFYKKLNEKDLIPIEKALQELEFPNPVPIFIISINKTESTDIVAFDKSFNDLIPVSGTYISIGNKKYLLFNNARTKDSFNRYDGFHFPVKLAIDCNKKELLNDVKTIHDLINQVYQFSRMYWKSLSQQNLPVTIKYPEMIAEIVPYFSGVEIPPYGKDKLWFL